jgi:hypothetical protein
MSIVLPPRSTDCNVGRHADAGHYLHADVHLARVITFVDPGEFTLMVP